MATNLGDAARSHLARVWPDFLQRVAAGELIKEICAELGVTRGMYRTWISEGGQERRSEWELAREASADAFADMAIEEALANKTQVEAAHARTRIDTLKWAARIRNPRAYGEKAQLDVNVQHHGSLSHIISQAEARLAARSARVIEPTEAPILLGVAQSVAD